MNVENTENKTSGDEIEINIADIIKFIKDNFKKILLWAIIFGIVGAVYSLTVQKEYESKIQIMPELQSNSSLGKMGGLSALAGLAGIDLAQMGGTEAVRPDLYPNILQSLPFSLYILNQKVENNENGEVTTLEEFFKNLNSSWLSKFFDKDSVTIKSPTSGLLKLTKEQEALIKNVNFRISTTFDRKSGVITINTKMPDPIVAAKVAVLSSEYLKEYVTNYRTDKTKQQVIFFSERVSDAKRRYQAAEFAVANFKDRNRFLVMASPKVEEARLTADFMFAQSVYNDLQRQYEQARIKVQEETPVFKILEPARIPLKRSEPKRTTMVLIFAFLGGIFGTVLCFWPRVKEKYLI